MQVNDRNQEFIWKCVEAAVDSGATDIVADPAQFPHCEIEETEASKRGESWTCASNRPIKKLGQIRLEWYTDEFEKMRTTIQCGKVGKTLVGCSVLRRAGYDTYLTQEPHLWDRRRHRKIRLTEKNGMCILKMWVKIPVNKLKGETMKVSEKEDEEVTGEKNGEEISCPFAGQSW